MGRELTNLSFEQWVIYVFDHPVPDRGAINWYHELESDWWNETQRPAETVAYLTRLFENATTTVAAFSDAQINQGFWFLVSNACSNHMFALLDTQVSWPERRHCISSFYTLFEQFFALRCAAHLSHLDRSGQENAGANPLNGVCYMWWDILPIGPQPKNANRMAVDATCLEVMGSILNLDSVACQESALHGLGHWAFDYPQQVKATIDDFLARHSAISPELKQYALAARKGRIL